MMQLDPLPKDSCIPYQYWRQITTGKDGMNYVQDEVSDNAILCPNAFPRKSLLHAEWHYSTIECEALGIQNRL